MTASSRVESATSTKGRHIVARLAPGLDLFEGIRQVCQRHDVKQGIVLSLLGSLNSFSFVTVHRKPDGQAAYSDPLCIEGALELVACQGTLGQQEGKLAIHLHGLAAQGAKLYSGHISEGWPNEVLATVELCLLALDDVNIHRSYDKETQFHLFHVQPEQMKFPSL